MNKVGIIDAVHTILGGTKVQAEQAVDTMLNSIIDSLKRGEEVSIAGLGIFSVKQRAARDARNPRTGEAIKASVLSPSAPAVLGPQDQTEPSAFRA